MKKFASILFLTLVLIQSSGFIAFFKIQESFLKNQIKAKLKNGIPDNELIKFTFSNTNSKLEWIHSKEFRYKGEMYDVISKNENADSTIYYVIHDPKETGLFANLDKYVNQEKQNDPQQKKIFLDLDRILKLMYIYEIQNDHLNIIISKVMISEYNFDVIDNFNKPETPPPKIV